MIFYEVKHNGVTIEFTHIRSQMVSAKARRFGLVKRDLREQQQIQVFRIENGIKTLMED